MTKTEFYQGPDGEDNHEMNTIYNSNVKQEIRERIKPINQQHHQEEPSDNYYNHNVKKTGSSHQMKYKIFSQPRNVKIGFSAFVLIIVCIAICIVLPPGVPDAPDSPFFQRFVTIITRIFKEIDDADLPGANKIMEHTVLCRRAANVIQHSVAFGSSGSRIATGLRDFGEKIMTAGRTLRKMYSKGSSVYRSFDVEIEEMIYQLDAGRARSGDSRYFKEKLNFLLTKIKEFREIVASTQMSIISAEEVRNGLEGYIIDGLRKADNFVESNGKYDIEKVKNELAIVNMVLEHLHESADHLDRMVKILMMYEDELMDLSADLDEVGNDSGLFVLTKKDLKYLRGSVESLKLYHDSFNRKAQIP